MNLSVNQAGQLILMAGIVSIEGNLGAGKTTLLGLLNVKVIREPVQEWQNVSGINMLREFYYDPKRWAFTFQLHALESRIRLWNKTLVAEPNRLHFAERSPGVDRYIFGQLQAKEGNMTQSEFLIYSQVSETLMKNCSLKAVIYLRCSPSKCLERMRKRNREGEKCLPLEYLEKVHKGHEEWVSKLQNTPVLIIDTEVYNINDKRDQIKVLKLMNDFIKQIGQHEQKIQWKEGYGHNQVSC